MGRPLQSAAALAWRSVVDFQWFGSLARATAQPDGARRQHKQTQPSALPRWKLALRMAIYGLPQTSQVNRQEVGKARTLQLIPERAEEGALGPQRHVEKRT